MQNFGMQGGGANGGAQMGSGANGGAPGASGMYGGGGASMQMHQQPIMQMPVLQGNTQNHFSAFKNQLSQYQQQQMMMIQQAAANGQISQQQMQHQVHQMNEKIRNSYQNVVNQLQAQAQQHPPPQNMRMGAPGAPQPDWRAPMPPGMSNAEKKKMAAEMQKRMQQQQQAQNMRMGAPGANQFRMQQMQQQMQNSQYARMGGNVPAQYPMGQMGGQMGQQGQQMHQQQPHGPASVSNAAQQQFQQQQQYYQQQHQQSQQMHMQHLQQQQQMAQAHHHNAQLAPPPSHEMAHQHAQNAQMAPPPPVEPVAPPPKPEDIKYKELLREMKAQYLEVLHGMNRRNSTIKGLVQMINVLEGDREIPYEKLKNLKGSLHLLMVRDCPTFVLMEEIRKQVFKKKEEREKEQLHTVFSDKESLAANCEKATKRLKELRSSEPLGVEPWSSVKHLEIKVPEHVRKLIESERSESPSRLEEKRKSLKRARNEHSEEHEAKRAKSGEEQEEEEDETMVPEQFVIKTVFDIRRPWIMPRRAREELSELSDWSTDEHCLPSCSTSPFIVLCLKSRSLHVNPLRVTLPLKYPEEPATIQFDRSFPKSSEYGSRLQMLFEKKLVDKGAVKSLTQFAEAYYAACDEYQQFLPKYQDDASSPETSLHSQKTPEIEYSSSHYSAAPPRPNSMIAHKGMVM